MAVSTSGFVLFFYGVVAMPPQLGQLMALAWALLVGAIGMAAWALALLDYAHPGRDFVVGALRTTCALPGFILVVVVAWGFLYALAGGG